MTSKAKALGTALENRAVNRAREKGLKAARQPMSGMLKDFPHDVVIEKLLVECKVRSASISPKGQKTLRLSMDWLRSVQASALKNGFAQGIVIVNEKSSQRPFVMVDLDFFLDLLTNQRV